MFKKFNLLRPVLAILIIFIPLYPKFPLANVTGTYVAVRLDDIVIAFSLLLYLLYQIKNKFPIFKEPVTKLMFAYYIAIIMSFITALFVYQTDPSQILLLHLLRRFEYTSVFFLAISTVKSIKEMKPFYIITFLTTLAILAYGYGQKYLSFPVISTMNSEFSKGQLLQMDNWTRISSTFAGHYDLAAYMSVLLIIITGIIVTQKKWSTKILNIILWSFCFHILSLTASRVSIFAFYGGAILTVIMLRRFLWSIPITLVFFFSIFNSKDLNQRLLATVPALKHQWITSIASPTSVPVLPTSTPIPVIVVVKPGVKQPTPIPTVFRHPPAIEEIPVDADVGVARSGEIRFNAEWPRAIMAFKKNPFLGSGLGSITLATDNDYLRLLGESGGLGFVTFMIIPLYFVIITFRKRTPLSFIFLGAMITFMVNATLIDVFEASKTAYPFWIMMGFYYKVLTTKSNR